MNTMNIVNIALNILFPLLLGLATALAALSLLHMLQLESYQGKMYLKWVAKHAEAAVLPYLLAGVAALLVRVGALWLAGNVQTIAFALGAALYLLMLLTLGFEALKKQKQAKKPLQFTARVKRLLVALGLLGILAALGSMYVQQAQENQIWAGRTLLQFIGTEALRYAPGALLPLTVYLAWLITWPFEKAVHTWYKNDAKKKLAAQPGLIRIAITGSFGKTSTKYALGTLLGETYNTLFTPGSFNTPMGVTKVIRESLTPQHEALIVEMGARYVGDIAELCDLVQPRYGILTAVGKQHLETFGSFENIKRTKAELIGGLGQEGCCFFNADDPACRELYEACALPEKYLFGFEGEGLYMRAEGSEVGPEGSTFTLCVGEARIPCATKLLGRHNITNITGAAALAYKLGVPTEAIAAGIARLEPVEHRLQLIQGPVTVIDDAFNANPVGAGEALEVLKRFSGRRIIVTPGMVELGEEQEASNRAFGEHMADCADIAILVGGNADAIAEGLQAAGFAEDCILRTATLAEASEQLPAYTEPGCVVLFENDLPDNYS
ncbi:MAG: UDP-N-acetylmuramoyl-tripeptide--D-alanyl-D-alanine ligase [Christensenellaceae bacterium]|jgi:UDP-N-acetylmuramoyl-tripeptide--D-alanyl-D-alanine ligase|nr:UDP-N-acetylmuramoyl-tripeptide--D-alanyl-D-alanine ligase [Christensenellaceae bacterium]